MRQFMRRVLSHCIRCRRIQRIDEVIDSRPVLRHCAQYR
jgi:hypothetical protein